MAVFLCLSFDHSADEVTKLLQRAKIIIDVQKSNDKLRKNCR